MLTKSEALEIHDWLIAAEAYPSFCSMKEAGVFLLPLDGMPVHHSSLLWNLLCFPNNSLVPIYSPRWREAVWELSLLLKNTTQSPWPGLEPGPLPLELSTLTIRPLHQSPDIKKTDLDRTVLLCMWVAISHENRLTDFLLLFFKIFGLCKILG